MAMVSLSEHWKKSPDILLVQRLQVFTYFICVQIFILDWFFETINKSDSYPFKSIKNTLKSNPIRITKTNLDSLEEASRGGGLVALVEDDRLMYLSKMYCNLVRMDEPISIVPAHLIFKKGSPLVKAFDEAIIKNKMLITRVFRKYMDAGAVSFLKVKKFVRNA